MDPNQLSPIAVDALRPAHGRGGPRGFLAQSLNAYRQYPHPAYHRALDYAALGDAEKEFASLEEACRKHDRDGLSLLSSPELDELRSDPRYLDLKRRIGFDADTRLSQ